MPASVAVLMSTYNGEAFLDAQLASLCRQRGVAPQIHIRDDGSTDGTMALLRQRAASLDRIASLSRGPNLGAAWSFLTLLRDAPDGCDCYAFCDQDDFWLPGKLARATSLLRDMPAGEPALYCSQVTCADQQLKPLGQPPVNGDTRFEHLLFENIAFGCTVVMNRAARDCIVARFPRQGVVMHDWWCALVVAGLGRLVYDSESHILYRQHGGNAIGAETGFVEKAWRLAAAFWREPETFYPVHAQAAELLRLHGSRLAADRRARVEALVQSKTSLSARIRYALCGEMVRSRLIGTLSARALVLAGLY